MEFLNCGNISLSYYNWAYILFTFYYKNICYFIMYIYNSWWRIVLFYSGIFSRLEHFKDGNGLIWSNELDILFLIKSQIWLRESIPLLTDNNISSMFIILSEINHPNFILRLVQCKNHRGDFQPVHILWGSIKMDHISYHCIINIHKVKYQVNTTGFY